MSNSLQIIMDEHCYKHMNNAGADSNPNSHFLEAFAGFQYENFSENNNAQRGHVRNDFVESVQMDWVSSNKDGPHNDVQQFFIISNFKPETVEPNTGISASKTASHKITTTATTKKLYFGMIPRADQIIKRQYRKYTEQQINDLFRLVFQKHMFASEAARETGIVVRTAQDYVRKARLLIEERRLAECMEVDTDEEIVVTEPVKSKERKYGNQKLFEEHSIFFLEFYEKHADATLNEARKAVMDAFPGLEITVSTISKHLTKRCGLTMKKLEKLPAARNELSTLEKRKEKILEWMGMSDFDYLRSCVFIDEAGFNLHIKRTFGRSLRGTPAKTIVSAQRGVSISIIGAMCELGIVNLMVRKPTAVASKKRKLELAESGVEIV
ncbi:uncharacterized protein BX663DRAFT_561018, partial [Cokeromyces recurvatus]|uniref:uncharacterized protein n=1 Tax=Cokeromyces recurvatus TaxID=90255 RepID=UPI00221FC9C1